jgi:DNA (cytosine-5)-methyltransferase 1
MRVGALFAGIGGLELGLHEAGHQTVVTCEISAAAVAVVTERFNDVPNWPDVRTIRSLPEEIDLLTAGFPCQDLSQAGMTAGIAGKRSGLVDHVFRLLDCRRIPVVVLENVSFMLQLDRGAAMNTLTSAFEDRGYRWAYRTVNSLLAEARTAETMPWPPVNAGLYRTLFPQLTYWLPEEEGALLRFEFEIEIARLDAAA